MARHSERAAPATVIPSEQRESRNPYSAEVQIPRLRAARSARDDGGGSAARSARDDGGGEAPILPVPSNRRSDPRSAVQVRHDRLTGRSDQPPAGGLYESIDERDQRDSHPHPSGRRPVAPLSSAGPSVVRRRRDVTAGAPSSGSRVRLCSLHHVTPADDAPRCCMHCVFLPDHRLSNSGSANALAPTCGSFVSLRSLGMTASVIPSAVEGSALRPVWWMKRQTPHLAPGAGGACRTAPIRSSKVCATARPLETRTLHHCFRRRAIGTRARSSCCTSLRSFPAFGRPAGPFAYRTRGRRCRPSLACPARARRWTHASSRRAGTGRRAVGVRSGVGRRRSWGSGSTVDSLVKLRWFASETRNRAADVRPTSEACRGWANAHAVA